MDDVGCIGNETSILDCKHRQNRYCDREDEGAGAECTMDVQGYNMY